MSTYDRDRRPAARRSRATRSRCWRCELAPEFVAAHHRRSTCTGAARRASARTSATTRPSTRARPRPGPCCPLAGTFTHRRVLPPPRRPRPLPRGRRRCARPPATTAAGRSRARRSTSPCARPGASLADALGARLAPVRFVVSTRLDDPRPTPPSAERVLRWLRRDPGLRFKLDPTDDWSPELIRELAGARRGGRHRHEGPVRRGARSACRSTRHTYRSSSPAFPDALIEDPRLTPELRATLRGHEDRVTWDAPIHSVDDIAGARLAAADGEHEAVALRPAQPAASRPTTTSRENGIGAYSGGQTELGPGRGQVQYLASLFHPDAPERHRPERLQRARPAATTCRRARCRSRPRRPDSAGSSDRRPARSAPASGTIGRGRARRPRAHSGAMSERSERGRRGERAARRHLRPAGLDDPGRALARRGRRARPGGRPGRDRDRSAR